MINKSDFDAIDNRLKNITEQTVEEIQSSCDLPPTIEQLEDNNKTYSINAAILFIDIRKSTYLTEVSQAKSMVKIYRAFMRMAVDCVRKNDGVTRQFLGDRIMGVFIDSTDEDGATTQLAVDKAINCARSLQTLIDFSLNKHLKNNVNGKLIECGIGIDYGKVLVTQVGMYGVENDEEKEDETDAVWVGKTTNYASKFSDVADGGEIFISNNVYSKLSDELKPESIWIKSAKCKGKSLYKGYSAKQFYLDFSEELGQAVIIIEDSTVTQDTSNQLAVGLKAVEELQEKLIKRERELAVLEDKLKKENERLKKESELALISEKSAEFIKDNLQGELSNVKNNYFNDLMKIINNAHCNEKYIEGFKAKKSYYVRLEDLTKKYFNIGKQLGYTENEIMRKADCGLLAIYCSNKDYRKAFDVTLAMATLNNTWVYLKQDVLNWAKENSELFKLINIIENRLSNNEIPYNNIRNFEGYVKQLKELRGH